ncbi:MAG TPA: glycosyltransferase family 1 protein [Candidatus Methylomirabilis sp.]|nr:glycosyltransferase family 1 protein [Candidatus Methylomirabilis sp.]
MRLTIDARMMGPTQTRGIGRYIEELVRAMLVVAPEHKYKLLVRDPERSTFQGNASVEHAKADVHWYGLAEQLCIPSIIAQTKPDLVHIPHWNVSIMSREPRVVTIHDLTLLEEPSSANVTTRGPVVATIKRLGYRACLRSAMKSRRILVPTQFVADQIRRHFPGLATPIDVTGEGMPTADESAWSEPDQDQPYLLYVGSAYPHKNLDRLLDAWQRVAPSHQTVSLVIAGDLDAFMRRTEARAACMGLPRVRFLGRVTDAELSRLYAKALAFVFPSRLEGFGLPPLEAMSRGCPVVASDASSLPEVLGSEGVIFFQPSNLDGMIRAVETVLRDPVSVRMQARHAVTALRERHDWRKAAERTITAYERAVK